MIPAAAVPSESGAAQDARYPAGSLGDIQAVTWNDSEPGPTLSKFKCPGHSSHHRHLFSDTDAAQARAGISDDQLSARDQIAPAYQLSALDHSQVIGDQTFYFSLSVSRRRSL